MFLNHLFQSHSSDSLDRPAKGRRPHTRWRPSRRSAFSPHLEFLENRAMLTTFTVTSLDDTGDGSLRDAIDSANDAAGADVIEFDVEGTIELSSELVISDELTINGPGQDDLTVSGGGSTRVFSNQALTSINNLTISDGHVSGFGSVGGGILNRGTLSLEAVTMKNNEIVDAARGGGGAIANFIFATLNVTDSTFDNNRAGNSTDDAQPVVGGAIANIFSNATISDSSFTNNHVNSGVSEGIGGAISNTFGIPGTGQGVLSVIDSDFEGNAVHAHDKAHGGAIGAGFSGGNVTIEDSDFERNSVVSASAKGGAIWSDASASVTFIDCSVEDNKAMGPNASGGGLFNAGTLTLLDAEITGNRAVGSNGVGGGLYNVGTASADEDTEIEDNKASTSNDDVFGDLDLLNQLLAV